MTKEDKELLLKDLCGRLPYGVKCKVSYNSGVINDADATLYGIDKDGFLMFDEIGGDHREFLCKPYLFPLSSMTEKQKAELENLGWNFDNFEIHNVSECLGAYREYVAHLDCFELIDWLNKNHFDYRSLIPKGLAIDTTGLNIYKEE